jgi:hypothetical protein
MHIGVFGAVCLVGKFVDNIWDTAVLRYKRVAVGSGAADVLCACCWMRVSSLVGP